MGSGVRGTTGFSEGQSCTYSVELYRSLDAHIHTVTYFVFAVASIYLQAVVKYDHLCNLIESGSHIPQHDAV